MNFEIIRAKNGFCIFTVDRGNSLPRDPWVFETLEKAFEFLKQQYDKNSALCGSCNGSGFIK